MTPTHRSGRAKIAALILVAVTSATLAPFPSAGTSASSAPAPAPDGLGNFVTVGDSPLGHPDTDTRGTALPSAVQKTAASRLGATVRWNRFGTPSSILPADGSLGTASGDPVAAARSWLRQHASLLGLSTGQVDALDLVNNQKLADSQARAVLFRQSFGSLTPARDSMVTVGVADGQVAYVSSSLVKATGTPPAATLTPEAAFATAATDVGRSVDAGDIVAAATKAANGFTPLTVPGFSQPQLTRLRSLALADGTVRPVFETNVVEATGANPIAYTSMVDAVTGTVLTRQNQVEHSGDTEPFAGEVTASACGPKHEFTTTDALTRQIVITAAAANTVNDIVIKLFGPDGALLSSGDLGTSPETVAYDPGHTLPQGTYAAQVCPFDNPTVEALPPYNYVMTVTTSDQGAAAVPEIAMPRWRYFPANPALDWSRSRVAGGSRVGCWQAGTGCTLSTGPLQNPYSSPWDYNHATHVPSLTTDGNNATTHEAWLSPLTPGGTFQSPIAADRRYVESFTDAWNNSGCSPTELVPGGNDINAVVTNLFAAHNRMHDYSYALGFTEGNYNMQKDNLGRNTDPTSGNDPEVGNAQAGAVSGGQPSYLGRDNANQIALQDGVPGITNQYLFQPIAGAFYSPCADGATDMSIVGHEYTHAISNRMIGGPDGGITSEQGGAMGESWSDLTAQEYLFSHGYSTGANPWAVGPYATGNKRVGIRDYAINANPLNYSDYGFDSTGVEVHADGEIWNGAQWEVRQALVKKWNPAYPYTDKALQLRCAEASAKSGPLPASRCPGNRRWIQLVFDSFLLQQGATSMLDARDAMLAADRMRFGGANQTVMWNAFAHRGMGVGASTPNADSGQPEPSFASRSGNATVKFAAGAGGLIYVGRYEARATPVADTRPATALDGVVRMTPGTYDFVFRAPGRGLKRFRLTLKAGETRSVTIAAPQNLASKAAGAKVLRSSAGSLNADFLIDDSEGTNWAGVNDGTNVDAQHPWVIVDLAGGVRTVHRVQVSAMLRPAPAEATDLPLAADPDSGSRFTALRKFAVEACVSSCSSAGATWKRIFTSGDAAFPGVRPRPVAPDLTLRSFDVTDTRAAALRFVALENQCTGYAGYAGEQDQDPLNDTDCKTASDRGQSVRTAEFEVY